MYAKKLLKMYKNGNYFVRIYDDGTKVRIAHDDFKPMFPENIDIKITSYCDGGCPMCHENSTVNGTHADLDLPFFDTLVSGTELAIGGGNPLAHPCLKSFLQRMKDQGVLCNITVKQTHLFAEQDFVQQLIDQQLVRGVGISFTEADDKLINFCKINRNCVIHLIVGIHGEEVLKALANKGLKVLWLGYKRFGRGKDYYCQSVQDNTERLKQVFYSYTDKFDVVSLDNAAMETLDVRGNVSRSDFDKHYMGDEGKFTMYIDAVDGQFAVNSVTPKEKRHRLLTDIKSMFNVVRQES